MFNKNFLYGLTISIVSVSISSCATNNPAPTIAAKEKQPENQINSNNGTEKVDPYEKFNRAMFTFNEVIDNWFIRPTALFYNKVTPDIAQQGITNFFNNLDNLTTIPNDLLQGKYTYFVGDTWRFVINSTFGIGGIFDPATHIGLPKHHEDFGLTLAYWSGNEGLYPKPYLVLPLLGPTTLCDAVGMIPDTATSPFVYIQPYYYGFGAFALDGINTRAQLLPADKLMRESLDPYIFVRDAYLQKRHQAIEKNQTEDASRLDEPNSIESDLNSNQTNPGKKLGSSTHPDTQKPRAKTRS